MKIIICLDDRNGMLFNKRRQSQDRFLIEKVIDISRGNTLRMHPYSQKMFAGLTDNICVDEHFLELAGQGEYCFVETRDISPYISSIEEIIIFRWNRVYPADFYFPKELLDSFDRKGDIVTFPGNSHDKICLEVYSK
jgi:hypothetical protein